MRKAIIAAVAALAIAPGFLMVSAPASAAPCAVGAPYSEACSNCIMEYSPVASGGNGQSSRTCYGDAVNEQAPANVSPNDPCAFNLQPPNPSVGAYNGCETARQATGG
jgi:hypothetical protein